MDKLYVLAVLGVVLWFTVLYSFIGIRIHRRWLAKKMNLQWIEKNEKRIKLPTPELIILMEKTLRRIKIMLNVLLGFTILSSIDFLIGFLLNMPHDEVVFGGLILAGECIPMWLIITLLVTAIDDRRKRIIEVMKETRSVATK